MCLAFTVPGATISAGARGLLSRVAAALLLAAGVIGPFYTGAAGMRLFYEPAAATAASSWGISRVLLFCVVAMAVALVLVFVINTYVLLQG